jgi:ribosomal protein S18 acetylase RimI-like enzyme
MIRPCREDDAEVLWELKRGFELGLGSGTGDDAKEATYREKLDGEYRESYLAWIWRCVEENERCVQLAEQNGQVAGYAFVLPESLSHVWDAAVLNEIFVREADRGAGVADNLMDAALSVAEDQDLPLDRIVLDVDRKNERARAFYDRWGFESWGEMIAREL